MPSNGLRKFTVKAPAVGELNKGVLYARQLSPASLVARTLAIVAPPVQIQAFLPPCVVTQVPLDAKENSPGNAGGMLVLISCQVVPSVVRRSGNTPFTESLCSIPRRGGQDRNSSSV